MKTNGFIIGLSLHTPSLFLSPFLLTPSLMLSLTFFYLYPCASRRMKKAKTDFKEYMDAFEDELQSFLQRVKERAQARIDKAIKEAEEVTLNKPFSNSVALTPASYFLSFMIHVVFRFLLCIIYRHWSVCPFS